MFEREVERERARENKRESKRVRARVRAKERKRVREEKNKTHHGCALKDRSIPSNYMLNLNCTIVEFQ